MNDLARRSWFLVTVVAIALAAGLAIAGAAVLGTGGGGSTAQASASARLSAFDDCDRLRGYLRRHREALGTGPLPPMMIAEDVAAAPTGETAAGAAPTAPTATNLQEAGVDEPDIVKASGSMIYAIAGARLRAVETAGGAPAVLGSVELPGGSDVYADDRELLLADGRALVISRAYGGPAGAYAPRTVLTVIDVSDPTAMRRLGSTTVDGSYVSARQTATTARIAISAYPELPVADTGRGRAFLPRAVVRRPGAEVSRRRLVGCDEVRRPSRFSGASMLTILTLDLARGRPAIDADAVMTGGETVYASPSSLYVATERWHDGADRIGAPAGVTTAIHRFDISDPHRTTYVASGAVDGYMLNQWSMSEHEGVLRVASTSSPPWNPDGTQDSESYLTTLVSSGDRLAQVGRLDGIGEGERIYAVRFIGELAYVVTFRQVDPLHVIDVSEPSQPRVAGELEIPGYSAYLHPVGPGLLLGIGQDATADGVTTGAQASLFDVSDPQRPVRTDHVSLGRASSAEVEYDHHAFTWLADQGLAVVPLSVWTGAGFEGAVGVRRAGGGLELTARTSHGGGPQAAIRRAVAVGGVLYTVSARGVAVHEPGTLERLAFTPFAGA